MNKLWAPWRKKYVTSKNKEKGCLFCNKFRSKKDKSNYLLFRSAYSFSMLNLYPYQNGHVMIAPIRHLRDLDQLNESEVTDLMQHLIHVKRVIAKTMHPSGFNVGINLGRSAGAGVLGHVHVHIVPRWDGDVNFMPVMSDTKIISESLDSVYSQIIHADKKISRAKRR